MTVWGPATVNRIPFPLASHAVIYMLHTCQNTRGLIAILSSQRRIVSNAPYMLPLPPDHCELFPLLMLSHGGFINIHVQLFTHL